MELSVLPLLHFRNPTFWQWTCLNAETLWQFKLAGHWRHQSHWVSSTARRGLRAPLLSGSSFSVGSSTPSDPTDCARWWTLSVHGRTAMRKTQKGGLYCRRQDQSISKRSPKWSITHTVNISRVKYTITLKELSYFVCIQKHEGYETETRQSHPFPLRGKFGISADASLDVVVALSVAAEVDGVRVHMDVH